jgi:hypothetical protein
MKDIEEPPSPSSTSVEESSRKAKRWSIPISKFEKSECQFNPFGQILQHLFGLSRPAIQFRLDAECLILLDLTDQMLLKCSVNIPEMQKYNQPMIHPELHISLGRL